MGYETLNNNSEDLQSVMELPFDEFKKKTQSLGIDDLEKMAKMNDSLNSVDKKLWIEHMIDVAEGGVGSIVKG